MSQLPSRGLDRRQFLHGSLAAVGGSTALTSLQSLAARAASTPASNGFGPLEPALDEATGLPLLKLPRGFRYRSFHCIGEALDDGDVVPPAHDGMGVMALDGDIVTICRNHEVNATGSPISGKLPSYDQHARGGCTIFQFDIQRGEVVSAWVGLSGTLKNCAGGPTPWGTWLSCEETVQGEGERIDNAPPDSPTLTRSHGWIFEVGSDPNVPPMPLKAMGRMIHEAAAIDPRTDIVYETEDRDTAGFYRFLPNERKKLAAGGTLEMMMVFGCDDLRRNVSPGKKFDTAWVAIEDVERAHSPKTSDTLGVFSQGKAGGCATFGRLEGCWYGDESIYLSATDSGNARAGQVWRYRPAEETIELIFESPSPNILKYPDNITVSPRGGLVLCEDSDSKPERIHGLTLDGQLFPFAENDARLNGFRGLKGDYRDSEWTGAVFSPDGRWLFANLQSLGVSFAITGPWEEIGI